jgi:hypothetical protein
LICGDLYGFACGCAVYTCKSVRINSNYEEYTIYTLITIMKFIKNPHFPDDDAGI